MQLTKSHLTGDTESGQRVFLGNALLKLHLTEASAASYMSIKIKVSH